ncbi:hypothetical protein H4582DRAFT_2057358 [Lactarius indigo]|nr:hypothetical protein H4582DRAFT_2057358 [Lactarius indigo]
MVLAITTPVPDGSFHCWWSSPSHPPPHLLEGSAVDTMHRRSWAVIGPPAEQKSVAGARWKCGQPNETAWRSALRIEESLRKSAENPSPSPGIRKELGGKSKKSSETTNNRFKSWGALYKVEADSIEGVGCESPFIKTQCPGIIRRAAL